MQLRWQALIAGIAALAAMTAAAAQPAPTVALTFDPTSGPLYYVEGSGFSPTSWIWITVDDDTDGSRLMDGPDAFQPSSDGSFRIPGEGDVQCAHDLTARAWVLDVVVATSTASVPACGSTSAAADPDASPAVQEVVASLRSASAPERTERRVVIGQALRGWDLNLAAVAEPVTSLTAAGLPAPKLLELDISDFTRDWGDKDEWDDKLYAFLAEHIALGGYVGLSHHVPNPFDENSMEADLTQLLDPANPNTPAQHAWTETLDKAVVVLRRLQDMGAVVFYRPLHESNQVWSFWYAASSEQHPEQFVALWRSVFEYVTDRNGIHNLVWVYAANRNDGSIDPTNRYPGDEVVDVVGLDIYHDDMLDAEPGSAGYDAMVRIGKPFAITEYGADAAYNDWQTGERIKGHDGALVLPNDEVIATIKARYPATVLATAWYSSCRVAADDCENGLNWQMSDRPNGAALLRDPWAITR